MNIIEIFIIYFTVGAPLGVYYFLQTRAVRSLNFIIALKTLGVIGGWPFYAVWLLTQKNDSFDSVFKLIYSAPTSQEKIKSVCANLEADFWQLDESLQRTSFYIFRQSLERYVGLTLAVQNSSPHSQPGKPEFEVFRLQKRKKQDLQLAARILHRKNFLKLQLHQIEAQQSLLQIIKNLATSSINFEKNDFRAGQEFQENLLLLAALLDDAEFARSLEKTFEHKINLAKDIKKDDKPEASQWMLEQSIGTIKALPPRAAHFKTMQSKD